MRKFIFSILLSCCCALAFAQAEDSTASQPEKPAGPRFDQWRFSVDLAKPIAGSLSGTTKQYEIALDVRYKNDLYLVAEIGTSSSSVNKSYLQYDASSSFIRLGVDNALFARKRPDDWSFAFVGVRYGMALVQRKAATYTIDDGNGAITSGTVASKSFTAHWLSLNGGMRLELVKKVFIGWTGRVNFPVSMGKAEDLRPVSIAGYGTAEKTLSFDYNFYLCFALRPKPRK